MIDLHCHILPGLDDGPGSMEESLEMARRYVAAGFSKVVATPHWVCGSVWMPEVERVRQGVAQLNAALVDQGIDLEVLAGMEIAMDGGIAGLVDQGRVMGIAGTCYVLVEPPFQQMPLGWEQVFFELMSKGWKVILAHPERCAQFWADSGMVSDLIGAGVILQVNYDSLLGQYGKGVEKMARVLVGKGYVHCLATDSHDSAQRHPGRVAAAVAVVEELVGTQAARVMVRQNPEAIVEGKPVEAPVVLKTRSRKKKRWGLF